MLQIYEIYQNFNNEMSNNFNPPPKKKNHTQLYMTPFLYKMYQNLSDLELCTFIRIMGIIKWGSNFILRQIKQSIQYQLCYLTQLKLIELHWYHMYISLFCKKKNPKFKLLLRSCKFLNRDTYDSNIMQFTSKLNSGYEVI